MCEHTVISSILCAAMLVPHLGNYLYSIYQLLYRPLLDSDVNFPAHNLRHGSYLFGFLAVLDGLEAAWK